MPELVADAIEEIARPNRGDQQEKPRIQAPPKSRTTISTAEAAWQHWSR